MNPPTFSEVYAVPGQHSIIDYIVPSTGLTCYCHETEAEVLERHPNALRMTWDDWQAEQAARQHAPIEWRQTTAEQYHDMLNVLPPAIWIGGAFMVGEPCDHDITSGQPRFSAFWERFGKFFAASRPMTRAEFMTAVRS